MKAGLLCSFIVLVLSLKNEVDYDLKSDVHHVDGTKVRGKSDDDFDEYYHKEPPKL